MYPAGQDCETASMNDPPTDPIAAARRSYAEELRLTAHVRSPAVIAAFAAVPRERFVGPGPWHVLSPMGPAEHWTTQMPIPSQFIMTC